MKPDDEITSSYCIVVVWLPLNGNFPSFRLSVDPERPRSTIGSYLQLKVYVIVTECIEGGMA